MYSDPLAQTRTYQKLVKQRRNEGLQQALLAIIEVRFPSLNDLARQKVPMMAKPDALSFIIRVAAVAPDESVVRLLLEVVA